MDGVRAGAPSGGDDRVALEVRRNVEGRVHAQRRAIVGRANADDPHAQATRGSPHALHDLAAVRDEERADRADAGARHGGCGARRANGSERRRRHAESPADLLRGEAPAADPSLHCPDADIQLAGDLCGRQRVGHVAIVAPERLTDSVVNGLAVASSCRSCQSRGE